MFGVVVWGASWGEKGYSILLSVERAFTVEAIATFENFLYSLFVISSNRKEQFLYKG